MCNFTSTFTSGMPPSEGCRIEPHTVKMAVRQVQTEPPPLHAWCHKPAVLEHDRSQATAELHLLRPILPAEQGRQNTCTEPHQQVALRQQDEHYFDSLTGMRSWMLANLAVASTVMMANVNRGCKSLCSKAETEGKIH